MQFERDALRVIKYTHRGNTHTERTRLKSGYTDTYDAVRASHTRALQENLPCVVEMLFLAATSREEFHSEYLAVKTSRRSLKNFKQKI